MDAEPNSKYNIHSSTKCNIFFNNLFILCIRWVTKQIILIVINFILQVFLIFPKKIAYYQWYTNPSLSIVMQYGYIFITTDIDHHRDIIKHDGIKTIS